MWHGVDHPSGLVLATMGSVAVTVLMQAPGVGAAWDRLAEVAPLTAVLLAGLWLLFKAYRALVERLIVVIDANTKAHTETAMAIRETAERIREMRSELTEHSNRIDRLEHPGRQRS
ncbi:MAG: hypothetical protein IT306_29205 [Chloroflexi bacterium]|nr:hypothetical protein [Chloroflexota bacterium]